jgi:alpha-L-rhamnosidase
MSRAYATRGVSASTLQAAVMVVLSVTGPSGVAGVPTATRLRVEYLNSPLSIDTQVPRFSWALEHPGRSITQTSYRVQVWQVSPASLDVDVDSTGNSGGGDGRTVTKVQVVPPGAVQVWDSGVVRSNRTLNVEYSGSQLLSDTDYVWTVSWTDSEVSLHFAWWVLTHADAHVKSKHVASHGLTWPHTAHAVS